MTVTDNLQLSFDKNREPHLEKLELLRALGIDPEFAEKCALMFEQIGATTDEIISQEKNLKAANDDIYEKLHDLELQRTRKHRKALLKASNIKKTA
ncbi:hypothetical protein BKN14_05455 [Candidatus Gracilibacteria bacterium HOT-871]|nr:hypothetical protein BKN14_05455 [Candidatus Gracilibacteria bacterium HOT-871]